MRRKLTEKQAGILAFIKSEIQGRGYPPTIREIGEEFGIRSTNGVRQVLLALEKKGYIKRRSQLSRGIELSDWVFRDDGEVPIIGRVAAGEPILAIEHVEGTIRVDSTYFKIRDTFALKVKGDSMRDAGIFDGDVVFARLQDTADKGDIVVAIIGDEATVKYFHPENGRVRLQPANPAYGPIVVERDTPGFRIAGKVVGLLRKM